MGWYDDLTLADEAQARGGPAGLAVVHTTPYAKDSGQRWKLFPYMRLIAERFLPILYHGGKAMLFMPPRHGKSYCSSVYTAAWYIMFFQTKNVILTSYGEDLVVGFSGRARTVVDDLGHLFGVRVNPNVRNAKNWQIQARDETGEWRNGGNVFAAGVDGALPGRGGHLIVMDDVVRGHKDTTPLQMEKAYRWYRGILETRLEPGGTILLVMTRWAQADLAGRLLEDEPEEWDVLTLPALAKEDDPLGRKLGEALCPSRFPAEELERRRDSSDEGGLIFSALYQQEPMPEGGAIFKANQMGDWEEVNGAVVYGNAVGPWSSFRMWFATIDPALKSKEINDPTGFLVFAMSPGGDLLVIDDLTARMDGSDDLLPLMHRVHKERRGIQFFVEEVAHGTEIIRAARREGLPVRELEADRDKVTRWIGAQPAFAAGKVFLPKRGAEPLRRELIEVPGSKHDDRADCMAYGVLVWRDRVRFLDRARPPHKAHVPAELQNVHPDDRPDPGALDKTPSGRWRPG